MRTAQDLLDELNAVDESTRIEAKHTSLLGFWLETILTIVNKEKPNGN